MKIKTLFLSLTMIYSCLTYSQLREDYHVKNAKQVVTKWLNNLNTNKHGNCYEAMSLKFKERSDSLDIIYALSSEINTFGEFMGRKEIEGVFCINPSQINSNFEGGFPDGYYVRFIFETKYKNWDLQADHSEIIWLHQDDNARWRILEWVPQWKWKEGYEEGK